MSTAKRSLSERHSDLSQRVILDAAVELLERASVSDLSVRAVARHAAISERTVFRHFATRDELLDAVAQEVSRRLQLPPEPASLEELLDYPDALYARFEAAAGMIKAVLHSELYHRVRRSEAERRGVAIRDLLDAIAPKCPERARRFATANVHYHLVATTWHYYRFYFGLSLEDSIACARMAIAQAIAALGVSLPGTKSGATKARARSR
ncbi:MAG TPA: helix-turn-helix domain-containing protein [Steroidobacteraceae bacterium]|nr:helix-turn-helix domain-containing protein [Steroidobacteraceae bacterium]